MTNSVFTQLCKDHGFIHKKQCFFRCIGDGVYQTIRVNESRYIDAHSKEYNVLCRRSKRVAIGLYSIYSRLPEDWFNPRFGAGTIDAQNIIGQRSSPFLGVHTHYEIMEKVGLTYLDKINTQEELLKALVIFSEFDPSLLTCQEICVPYLICGKKNEANRIIESRLQDDHFIKWCNEFTDDWQKGKKNQVLYEWQELKELIYSEEKLSSYIQKNMQRNCEKAEHYGLKLTDCFSPILL